MKRYNLYSKRDPAKNFLPLSNEVFYLGLSYGAIAVYRYLMHIEDITGGESPEKPNFGG